MNKSVPVRWASFRDLEIIKALIEKGSATLAAEYLGITQPSVSKVISNIEEKSGKTLFIREKMKFIPTKDCLFLYEEIINIFSSLARIDNNNWSITGQQEIRAITTPTIAYSFLSPLVASYIRERNNIKIILSVVNSIDMINEIREGKADIALGNTDIRNRLAEISVYPIFKTKIVCIMHKNHELAKSKKLTLSDLHNQNVIMYTSRNILFPRIKKACSDAGVQLNIIAEVSDALLALNFVNENLGIYFAPSFPIINHMNSNLVIKDVGLDIYDEMAIFSLTNALNPHFCDFIDYIAKHVTNTRIDDTLIKLTPP